MQPDKKTIVENRIANQHISVDSLAKRYGIKLIANLVNVPLSIVTQSIVPRYLGPINYGNFSFVTDFFAQVVSFLDSGSSIGFYAKLSQRPGDHGLVRFYLKFALLSSVLLCSSVALIFLSTWSSIIWPGQEPVYVFMGALWGLLTWFSQILLKMVDAYGLTWRGEVLRIVNKFLALGLLVGLFAVGPRSLTFFFLYQYFTIMLLCYAWWTVLAKIETSENHQHSKVFYGMKHYAVELYTFSSPLFVYAVCGLVFGIFDRWLLQQFSGSTEQAFYGLSYQVGVVCFVFTGAMTPLFLREMSIASKQNDHKKMLQLYEGSTPPLFTIAAYFAIYVSFQADKVSLIFGGNDFQAATLSIAVMAFYPVHQTYGQLNGSFFLGTNRTKHYRNIGLVMMPLGFVLSFLLVAPKGWYGLNLASTGLAIKMVVHQFLWVNVQLWFIARFLQLSFWNNLARQIYVMALFALCAWASVSFIDTIVSSMIYALILSGIIYSAGISIMVLLAPFGFPVEREFVKKLWKRVRAYFKQWVRR